MPGVSTMEIHVCLNDGISVFCGAHQREYKAITENTNHKRNIPKRNARLTISAPVAKYLRMWVYLSQYNLPINSRRTNAKPIFKANYGKCHGKGKTNGG